MDVWRITDHAAIQWKCHMDLVQGTNGSVRGAIEPVPWTSTIWCQWGVSMRWAKLASLWIGRWTRTWLDCQQLQASIAIGKSWTTRSWRTLKPPYCIYVHNIIHIFSLFLLWTWHLCSSYFFESSVFEWFVEQILRKNQNFYCLLKRTIGHLHYWKCNGAIF